MNCTYHSDRPATAYCRTCGHPLCADDQREIYGIVYCQECVARNMGQSGPPLAGAPAAAGAAALPDHLPNPGVALLLGFIPGVGAIYNGQYLKAFLQVVVFGFLIAMVNSTGSDTLAPLFGIAIAAFYFYMLVDSYRTAKQMSLGLPVTDMFGAAQLPVDAPIAAIVLIAIGGVFLLRSLGLFAYDFSRFLWPGLLIVVGVYLLRRRSGGAQ